MALYIVSTPIGNLKDITYRGVETLTSVNTIIMESKKDSLPLLSAFDIKPKYFFKFNEENVNKISSLINHLKEHDAAYITSAGTPGISDPGTQLVNACLEEHIQVIPIPGPSALSTILSLHTQLAWATTFVGFFPKNKTKLKKLIDSFVDKKQQLIGYESTHRIEKTLEWITQINSEIHVLVGKEMTKKFETYLRGTVSDILKEFKEHPELKKGEFTLLLYLPKSRS